MRLRISVDSFSFFFADLLLNHMNKYIISFCKVGNTILSNATTLVTDIDCSILMQPW